MAYIPERDLEKARQEDLLSYLRRNDPSILVRVTRDEYSTREHDSLKIHPTKGWYWFSRRLGGWSALDYLVYVKGMEIPDAVAHLLGNPAPVTSEAKHLRKPKPEEPKQLKLPEKNSSSYKVFRYLVSRGISRNVIHYCICKGILYESQKYHSAVFVGKDEVGAAKYAFIRGTYGSFKSEAYGSDKTYSFKIAENEKCEDLHLFEAAIDLLSYVTILQLQGVDWRSQAFLSLGGVAASKGIPKNLAHYLNTHPSISVIHLHLDNDEPGRLASKSLLDVLSENYLVQDEPPPGGKDVNEYLLSMQAREATKEDFER